MPTSFVQPSVADFVLSYPTYADPEYLPYLNEVFEEVLSIHKPVLDQLPDNVKLVAHKFLVCHNFQMKMWQACYGGSAPNLVKSRNDSFEFKTRRDGLWGSECGRNYLALVKTYLGKNLYAGGDYPCPTTRCGGC